MWASVGHGRAKVGRQFGPPHDDVGRCLDAETNPARTNCDDRDYHRANDDPFLRSSSQHQNLGVLPVVMLSDESGMYPRPADITVSWLTVAKIDFSFLVRHITEGVEQ